VVKKTCWGEGCLNISRRAEAGGAQGIELQVEVAVTVLPQQFPMFSIGNRSGSSANVTPPLHSVALDLFAASSLATP
jgi:hypothetical protein